jgi:mannosyltransferase OCH1-like enzyme
LDLDIGCRLPLDTLLQFSFVMPLTEPIGFSNDFFMAEPKHDFLDKVIHALPSTAHTFGTKYLTVMASTGPMFLTHQYVLFEQKDKVRFLSQKWYGGRHEASFFYHVHGSSWHGDDAKWILFIYKHPFATAMIASGFILCLVMCKRFANRKPYSATM